MNLTYSVMHRGRSIPYTLDMHGILVWYEDAYCADEYGAAPVWSCAPSHGELVDLIAADLAIRMPSITHADVATDLYIDYRG